jgi:hypothetical protein
VGQIRSPVAAAREVERKVDEIFEVLDEAKSKAK